MSEYDADEAGVWQHRCGLLREALERVLADGGWVDDRCEDFKISAELYDEIRTLLKEMSEA